MSTHDPINNAFEKKIQSLNNTKEKLTSLIGSEPPKGMTPLAMMLIVENIRQLYEIDQEIYITMERFRNEVVNLLQKNQTQVELKTEVKDLGQRFKNTFGSLEDRLNKINSDDENKRNKGDNPYYG
jgi:predicted ribosome quality control (RQC) complex YloA/Tae2 family protein